MISRKTLSSRQALLGGLIAGIGGYEGAGIFMPIAICFLWAVSRSPFNAFLWGTIAVLLSHRWLLFLHPLDWVGIPSQLSLPLSISIWLICGVIGGTLVSIWAGIGNFLLSIGGRKENRCADLSYALILSCLWGLIEVALAGSPFFWIGVGGSILPFNIYLAGLARWIGAGGLASIQLLIGWWVWRNAMTFKSRIVWKKTFSIGFCALIILHLIGWILLIQPETKTTSSMSVALWQTSIPTREKFSPEQELLLPKKVQDSLDRAKDLGAAFLVAPEGTLRSGQDLVSPSPIPFLSGGFRKVNGQQRSSLLAFNRGETVYSEKIDKYRLVPLGEWVPNWLGNAFNGLSAVGGIEAGDPSRFFKWSGPPFAGVICYEISDGSSIANAIQSGSEWILAIANLDPYPLLLQKQFLANAQLRSIETSRDLLSVSNTGPSSLILPTGKIVKLIEPFQEDLALSKIHFNKKNTGYMIWREAPLALFIFFGSCQYFWPYTKNEKKIDY